MDGALAAGTCCWRSGAPLGAAKRRSGIRRNRAGQPVGWALARDLIAGVCLIPERRCLGHCSALFTLGRLSPLV
ncbi:hypothetical protein CCMA1212_000978 [Trichoderma ghanense]|uniref:Uncharacterized protein n=1 Tax=Trichoderma ghanense TaxID=65468 RepID=A0ABY2HEJ4_9HYPO